MMLFNSYIFIFAFLPILTAVYFLCAKTGKTWLCELVFITASVVFYTALDWRVATVLFVSVTVNFVFLYVLNAVSTKDHNNDRKAETKGYDLSSDIACADKTCLKFLIYIPIILNVALLLYFKYTNFFIENINLVSGLHLPLRQIVLPVGISFFTFQQIAYMISFYRGELTGADGKAAGFLDYLTFILYFPKLVMGPLMEPADFLAQMNDPRNKKISARNIACGIKIFSYGLFKKMILADTFAQAVNWGIYHPVWASALDWSLIILFNSFMIYFDFSGYTDMATGVSLIFNVKLPINFDSPYKANSVRDFWKRWHISLTRFLTKYIYVPLGGNRKGLRRTCINVMLVFFISGLWHGANLTFILWGLLHGILSVAERLAKHAGSCIRTALTFGVVSILWLLFTTPSVYMWGYALVHIFTLQGFYLNVDLLTPFTLPESSLFVLPVFGEFFIRNAARIWMVLLTLLSAFICFVPQNNYRNLQKLTRRDMVLTALCFVAGVMALGQDTVFIYFNF